MSAITSQLDLTDDQFQAIGRAIADPRRFAILKQIAESENLTCSALQAHAVITAATISHHLKELTEAGLVQMERCGRVSNITFCRPVWQAYRERLAEL